MSQLAPAQERTPAVDRLDGQRRHVLGALTGLPDDDPRPAVLASGWTCPALVRHPTLDFERCWFAGVVAGAEWVDCHDETGSQPPPGEPAEATTEEI